MVKLVSISGLVYMVKDLTKTAEFYESIGFLINKADEDRISVRLNWFWIDFIKANNFRATGNDGQYTYVSVDDVDEIYKRLTAKGHKLTEPQDFKTGRRETMITDPDGYKLVFFTKK